MSQIEIYNEKYNDIKSIEWDFINSEQGPISKLHPYPARFIESIPAALIDKLGCPKDTYVFDPFCGSGTTLLEAQKRNIKSIGVDLNPIACLISRVKMQPLDTKFLERAYEVCDAAHRLYEKEDVEIPKIPNIDHWFKADIQKAISTLMIEINKVSSICIKDALSFSLSSIIVRVSNQESDTRYAAIDNKFMANDVYKNFMLACNRLLKAKENMICDTESILINEDILKVTSDMVGEKVGLVITSPPYPNAYEYWLYHKYRMWWLGYDPINVRTYEIGARPHYQKKNGQTEVDFYNQMDEVFNLFDKILIAHAHVCIVIGRSIIKGRVIDNAQLIKDIGKNHNYELVVDIERSIAATKKSFNLAEGKIRVEDILIFRRGE